MRINNCRRCAAALRGLIFRAALDNSPRNGLVHRIVPYDGATTEAGGNRDRCDGDRHVEIRQAASGRPGSAKAEALIATVQEAGEGAELATKADLGGVRADLKADIAALRADLKAEMAEFRTELKAELAELRTELKLEVAAIRSEMQQLELRLEARIEAIKADILNRVFGLIPGAVVVNVVAIVGAMFGLAKLLGH